MPLRIFTAVDLNGELKENIAAFTEKCRTKQTRGVRYVEKENLHITMKFLGEMPEDKVEKLAAELSAIELPATEIAASGAGAFPNVFFPSVLWVGIKDDGVLERLFLEIEEKASVYGVARETRKFHPHATIARLKGKAESGLVELVKNCRTDFGKTMADYFTLMKSDLTPEGPVYTMIGKFPMQTRR